MGLKIDDDLLAQAIEGVGTNDRTVIIALLLQILRELRKEGPEEKSKPIVGFGR